MTKFIPTKKVIFTAFYSDKHHHCWEKIFRDKMIRMLTPCNFKLVTDQFQVLNNYDKKMVSKSKSMETLIWFPLQKVHNAYFWFAHHKSIGHLWGTFNSLMIAFISLKVTPINLSLFLSLLHIHMSWLLSIG